jgi:Predicted transcriptional regulators
MALAMRIRAARIRAGFSQADLASKIGVSRTAIANWESAKSRTRPSSERLEAICHLAGVSWEWLATGRGTATFTSDSILAMDVDLVEDPVERRLLALFRQGNSAHKEALIALLESGMARQR